MMRGPKKSAMAVRRPNGEIFFEEEEIKKKKRPAICRWPIVRGVFGFIDSMVIGYKALMRSADIALEEMPDEDAAQNGSEGEKTVQEPQKGISDGAMLAVKIFSVVFAVLLALFLFMWLPAFLYSKLELLFPEAWVGNRWLRSAFEGVLKILIIVAYMAAMLLMKDIRRTFMYHGAEHKTIFCYENGVPLTVANVREQRRFHPRCGTSFLILMMLVSILIGFLIPAEFDGISPTLYTVLRTLLKLLLFPINMGVGYEILKLAGRYDNIFTRILSAPGLWLQRVTVKEPTDDMIECAIKAFIAVLPEEEKDAEIAAAQAASCEE